MDLEKTRIKLSVSKQTGKLIGFVSRHSKTGQLKGVREDTRHSKKICLIDKHIIDDLKPDVLYEVEVKPMWSGAGYVIVSAEPVCFPATIEVTLIHKQSYRIEIYFGNKRILYDPIYGRQPSVSTVEGVIKLIDSYDDLEDKESVIQKFSDEASKLLNRMLKDGVKL